MEEEQFLEEFDDIIKINDTFIDRIKEESREVLKPKLSRYLEEFQKQSDGVVVNRIPKSSLSHKDNEKEKETVLKKYMNTLTASKINNVEENKIFFRTVEGEKQKFYNLKKQKHKELVSKLKSNFKIGEKIMKKRISKREKLFNQNYGKLIKYKPKTKKKKKKKEEILKLELRFLLGIKNKLPKGKYVFLFKIKEEISEDRVLDSGNLSKLYSTPFLLSGNFSQYIINFNAESIFLTIPSYFSRLPYLNLEICLIQLKGNFPGLCVGWSLFPLLNNSLTAINGYFKIPILRGFKHNLIHKFSDLHLLLKKNLDNWLGNLFVKFEPQKKNLNLNQLKNETDLYFDDLVTEEKKLLEENPDNLLIYNFENNNKFYVKKIKTEEKFETIINNSKYQIENKIYSYSFYFMKIFKYIIFSLLNDFKGVGNFIWFWFFFVSSYYIRLYFHFFSQYLFLLNFIKDVKYYPSFLWVYLSYQNVNQLTVAQEFLNILIGIFSNLFLCSLIIFIFFALQNLFKLQITLFAHKFILIYFINIILDELYNIVFDAINDKIENNNFVKLFYVFKDLSNYKNGIWGILITVSLYSWFYLLALILIYFFLLKVYRNGQIYDIYERLNENKFFIPENNEVDRKELYYAIEKAKRFRGQKGEKRTTKVFKILEKDKFDSKFENYYLLISIVNEIKIEGGEEDGKAPTISAKVASGDKKKIHRQFLVIPSKKNMILEIFNQNHLKQYFQNFKID